MGWASDVVTEFLEPESCVPAVGQGALSIECRNDDTELLGLLGKFTCSTTSKTVRAERAFLHRMEGGCQVPIAGYAYLNDNEDIILTALVGSPDGKQIFKEQLSGKQPEQLGELAAQKLIDQGAKDLIDKVKQELDHE